MKKNNKTNGVSIIVPSYNEKDNIPILVKEVFAVLGKMNINSEIIIVDDNSPDGTGKVADLLAKRYKKDKKRSVVVIHRAGKLGLGTAVVEGFKRVRYEILGVMDADLQHPPAKVKDLVKPIIDEKADYTIGSRYVPGGSAGEEWSIIRKIISKVAAIIAIPVTRAKDPGSGFFFLNRDVIEGVNLNPRGYKINLEILAKGNYSRLEEIPFTFRIRERGESKLNAKEYVDYIHNIMRLTLYKVKRKIVG